MASLALVDAAAQKSWIIDCTPDFPRQLRLLDQLAPGRATLVDGLLLTHAHIGHYTGLIYLGPEALAGNHLPVYTMPRMASFLQANAPWSGLIENRHVELFPLAADEPLALSDRITITPLLVPHRDEYSETVGFRIAGPRRAVLYLPDIDRWEKWATPLTTALAEVDVAYLDGTFFSADELPHRNLAEVPHPAITETIRLLEDAPASERAKVRFLHLNHTNPALNDANSAAAQAICAAGHSIAVQGETAPL